MSEVKMIGEREALIARLKSAHAMHAKVNAMNGSTRNGTLFGEAADMLAASTPPAWMPIESAPKDGTESLFYTVEFGCVVMYWAGSDNEWSSRFSYLVTLTPTHWMPLPKAP